MPPFFINHTSLLFEEDAHTVRQWKSYRPGSGAMLLPVIMPSGSLSTDSGMTMAEALPMLDIVDVR